MGQRRRRALGHLLARRRALRDAHRRGAVQGRDARSGVAMKHVNEPMPDVQKRRPEVSSALAAVVERATREGAARSATATWPRCSPTSRTALEVEVARAGGAHGEATTVLDAVAAARRRILAARRVSAAGVVLVLAATAAALLIAALSRARTATARRRRQPAAAGRADRARPARQDFDPSPATASEHPTRSSSRSTANPTTGWTTETYDRRRPRRLSASRASA